MSELKTEPKQIKDLKIWLSGDYTPPENPEHDRFVYSEGDVMKWAHDAVEAHRLQARVKELEEKIEKND